jgi:integrase
LRVRVYAGTDPVTGRRKYLTETVSSGEDERVRAEEACRRLLGRVRRRRCLRTDATVDELLDRHLALLHCSEHTRQSHEWLAAKHIRPVLGRLRLRAVTPERLDGLYAEVLRCREHCSPRPEVGHVCRPLHPGTVRKIHYVLSSAFRRAVRWGWIDWSPTGAAAARPQPHPEPRPPTPTEAARILTEAWTHPDLGRWSGWPWPPAPAAASSARCAGGTSTPPAARW